VEFEVELPVELVVADMLLAPVVVFDDYSVELALAVAFDVVF
jgi:hypothetical protein